MTPDRAIAPQVSCIQDAFERVVTARVSQPAVVCGEDQWSYEQLNAESNRIAHALIALGIEYEEPVAISLPRSCEYIAAMLGVLKAGGAYVPVVDNQPTQRLCAILQDCGARFMLSRDDHLPGLHDQVERVITRDLYKTYSHANTDRTSNPSDLAYILYTSGSTGDPKGVMIEHDGVHRLVHDQWFMPTGPNTNYLCVSSFGFDASTIEIYATLLHGATLVMTTRRVPEPDEVRTLIERHDVRAAWIAFGFFGALFEADPNMFQSVETVMTGGEPVHAELIRRAQRALPNTRFVNSYGPTECTALSTAYEIPVLDENASGLLPIGRRLRGMSCSVVDKEGNTVSEGGQGELLISGIGITRGYLNAPEQTAKRILLDEDGNRVFRSGDLVRVQPDGNLMFLGRIDAQVKLRGNRFELGEVEANARSHPHVEECVACIINHEHNEQLAILIVPSHASADPQQIKSHLDNLLPEYMVPTQFILCDAIPLTRNGKSDRSASRDVIEKHFEQSSGVHQGSFSTQTELQLASVMGDVLGTRVMDSGDRFLDLGGHSLRALVLCARIEEQFGVQIPISSIYQLATIRDIASEVDRHSEDPESVEHPVAHSDPGSPAPLSFNQLRLWMHDQIHPGDPSYTITMRLDHQGTLDKEAFSHAWSYICNRHEILHSRIDLIDEEPVMVIDHKLDLSPTWTDVESNQEDEITSMIERASMRGFDLEAGPLVRCRVFRTHANASVAIMMHHIVSDGWSCAVLQQELADAYKAYVRSQEPSSEPLNVQYSDYARWERSIPDRDSYKQGLQEWCDTLRGAPMLRLPADHIHSERISNAGIRVEHLFERDDLLAVQSGARSLGVTPFVYMLGVFKIWLARLTLTEDVVVGTPVANRRTRDTQRLIGFFMETLPLRSRVPLDRSVQDIIAEINQNTMQAFDRRDVPFQHIVQALGLHGRSDQNPLFEVFFNHIAIPLHSESDSIGTLSFSDQEIDNRTAKFDLTCYVFEDAEHARIVFNARRSKFSAETVQWFLHQFISLLSASPHHLDQPAGSLPIDLSPITTKNPAKIPAPELPSDAPVSGTIIDRIQQVVSEYPNRLAVRSPDASMSYAQLWARANAVAARLQHNGVEQGDRVLILTHDAIDTTIATLGVLQAGGVFVPTDHHWPRERVRKLVEAADAKVALVSDQEQAEHYPCSCIQLNSPSQAHQPREVEIAPDYPAYLLFTSGSTGEPRGVLQSHAAVVGHMVTFAHALNLSTNDKLLQLSSFAFDASIMDMFACWFTGATLCVADPRTYTPDEVAEWMTEQTMTVFHAAPSLFRWFTQSMEGRHICNSIRSVVLGGEHATDHDIDSILTIFPSSELLINGFGLTESSLNMQYRVDPNAPVEWPSRLPIGYPVEGVSVRLVNDQGEPSYPTGEIEIESDRIAVAYTSPFTSIGSPVSGKATKRFRTGDLGTIRYDGSMMHLGRLDDQVQIRGCRVEPAEVAAAIRSQRGVHDAAVLHSTNPAGEAQLHAFVVCSSSISTSELTQQCAELLPAYMLPATWTRVAAIPRVGGGKVDRHALRLQEQLEIQAGKSLTSHPVDERTIAIMHAFSRVLGAESIGPDDNFFHCGGNSLRAIQLFAALRDPMRCEIPISVIYRSPTPRSLAHEYAAIAVTQDHTLIELNPSYTGQRVIVLPGIGGHPLGFGPLIDRVTSSAHFVGVQYPDESVLDDIGRSLPALASWVIAKLGLNPTDAIPDMIGYSFGGSLAMEIAMQLRQDDRQHGRLLLLDAHLPFGLPQRGRFGKARVHLARIVEGHETSRLRYITQRLRSKPMTDQNSPERADELDPYRAVSRINRQMVLDYEPTLRYDGTITLIRALQPEWLKFHHDDGYNGFSAIADPQKIKRVEIDAGHLELFDAGPVASIARLVSEWIDNQ